MPETVLFVVSLALAVLALPVTLYLGTLAILARDLPTPIYSQPTLRFAIVVPAHNEESGIEATISSLTQIDWPESLRDIVVVADNCTDATAERAERAGAQVLTRVNEQFRGKGYALEFAFDELLQAGEKAPDAVVVVDADTIVSRDLIQAFAARLSAGEKAIQAEYAVRNSHASWRTRLLTVALALFHRTRSLARERLGVSVGLRGNGMCFSTALLREHPHKAYGLVEDAEYGIDIGMAGVRVAFAAEAAVFGEMVASGQSSVSQRRRWEEGRAQLARARLLRLLKESWRQRSLLLLDLAMDILVPPLSRVALYVAVGVALEIGLGLLHGSRSPGLWLWSFSVLALLLYVGRGVQHSGLGILGGLAALAYAPIYVAWKLTVWRPRHRSGSWVRTQRESEHAGTDVDTGNHAQPGT